MAKFWKFVWITLLTLKKAPPTFKVLKGNRIFMIFNKSEVPNPHMVQNHWKKCIINPLASI